MTSILEVHNVKVYGTGEKVVFLSHGFGTGGLIKVPVAKPFISEQSVASVLLLNHVMVCLFKR